MEELTAIEGFPEVGSTGNEAGTDWQATKKASVPY